MKTVERILAWFRRAPLESRGPETHCPNCGLRFNEWFFWPGEGDYCFPCYYQTGYIYVRTGMKE